jgi:flagellar motor switch protein FliN/FliY
METLEKYAWLKKVNKALLKSDQIPLMRSYGPFNFEELSSKLKNYFSLSYLSIEPDETKWLSKDQIKSGLADNVNYLSFIFSPLQGNVYFLMDLEDVSKLTNELLTHKNQIKFSSTILQESYFRFIALEILNILTEMNLFQNLSAKMVESTDPLSNDAFCIDIKIKINEITCFARIAINSNFRKAWEKYFINNPPLKALETSKALELIITAELGYVKLNYQILKKVKNGDFIILDKINYDPKTNKGQITLKLDDIALFLAKIKQNKIKIVDFANYREEPYMEEKKPVKENNEEAEKKVEIAEEKGLPVASLENMPVTIIVEAARFKITLDKLINLQPGNLLDLAIHPETYVNLTVNGQKIASAELVNLGETLGVRIVEMG